MASMSYSGWFNESVRHGLAAKGIKTRQGYFSKGNTRNGLLKSILATPKKDESGNPIIDPFTGKPLYPKQSELGLDYVKRAPRVDFSNPDTMGALQQQIQMEKMSRTRYSPDFSRLSGSVAADEFAAPTEPPSAFGEQFAASETTPPVRSVTVQQEQSPMPTVTPQMQRPVEREGVQEKMSVREYARETPIEREGVRDRMSEAADLPGAGIADKSLRPWLQKTAVETPSVPPETRSLQDESFEVTI